MQKSILAAIAFVCCLNMKSQEVNSDNPGTTKSKKYLEDNWRKLSNEGKNIEAASELLYLVMSDSTRNKHADYWHIGQIYAMDNQYEKAVFYMHKSMQGITEESDQQFWWYYKGSIAFLESNKEDLESYALLLEENHTTYHSNNSKVLKKMLERFDKPYSEVFQ